MNLLKVLAMPFQVGSLLFVAASSLVLGLIISMGSSVGIATIVLSLYAIWAMLVWLTNYALRLIDDVANGVREASAASAEMLTNPLLDSRCWVHPVIAVGLGAMHHFNPSWPVWPTLLVATLVFPVSIGACAMSGHARDALKPAAMVRVVLGLGPWYGLLVVLVAGCALLGVVLARVLPMGAVLIASEQLLLLVVYAAIGGVLYERRIELAFEPRLSPERRADLAETERLAGRQHFLDGLYNDLRVRETKRAIATTRQWLAARGPNERAGDLQAILQAGGNWKELREYPRLLQGLVPALLELKQPALAYTVAEAVLATNPGFTAESEADATALVGYALATGRRRGAGQLLQNYLGRAGAPAEPGPQLAALRARLQPPV
jgi:hypothetical protein